MGFIYKKKLTLQKSFSYEKNYYSFLCVGFFRIG